MENSANTLQLRLRDCIQTILEREPPMHDNGLEQVFARELDALRAFLEQVDGMTLVEADVCRLETATAVFLSELRPSMGPVARGVVQ